VTTGLLAADGTLTPTALREAPRYSKPRSPLTSRIAYAAAHVVPKSSAENVPGAPADIDWDETLGFRHHLWSWGLGVADAMDTAQRNMGLDAIATRELIRRSAIEARAAGGALVVGVNTDHVDDEVISLDAVIAAYLEQLHFAEDQGAGVVLMASRHLARAAQSGEDYEGVYREVLSRAGAPVVLHWLGGAFDPVLSDYFGSSDWEIASQTVVRILQENSARVSGIKMSLLDASAEISVRTRLPEGITMFTGDDFNYVGLIEGAGASHSNALLGAFAAIGPTASAAIQALDLGDVELYRAILGPSEALSRQIFRAPTFYYKTGIAFLSWLNGHQSAFTMIGGLHSARSLVHLSEIVRLANAAGCLEKPDLAAERWNRMLILNGFDR
jgi:hypothetical protein